MPSVNHNNKGASTFHNREPLRAPLAALSGSPKQKAWALRIRQECLARFPWGLGAAKGEGMRRTLCALTSASFFIRERDVLQRGIAREIEGALRRQDGFRKSMIARYAKWKQGTGIKPAG